MASNLHKSLTSVRIRLIVGLTAILLVVLGIAINGFWAFAAMRSSAYNATSVGGSLNSIGLEIQVHNLETYRLIELARGQNQEKALPRLEEAALEIEDEYSRMGAELAIAQRLQRMILPGVEEIRAVPGMDIAAFTESATEVGGLLRRDCRRARSDMQHRRRDCTGRALLAEGGGNAKGRV
jgi:hypothetical protein